MFEDRMQETPRLLRRAYGGWLAISPADADLQIGVTGSTEEEAGERFRVAWSRCIDLLADAALAQ